MHGGKKYCTVTRKIEKMLAILSKFCHIKWRILNGEIPDHTKLVIISGAYCTTITLHTQVANQRMGSPVMVTGVITHGSPTFFPNGLNNKIKYFIGPQKNLNRNYFCMNFLCKRLAPRASAKERLMIKKKVST